MRYISYRLVLFCCILFCVFCKVCIFEFVVSWWWLLRIGVSISEDIYDVFWYCCVLCFLCWFGVLVEFCWVLLFEFIEDLWFFFEWGCCLGFWSGCVFFILGLLLLDFYLLLFYWCFLGVMCFWFVVLYGGLIEWGLCDCEDDWNLDILG